MLRGINWKVERIVNDRGNKKGNGKKLREPPGDPQW